MAPNSLDRGRGPFDRGDNRPANDIQGKKLIWIIEAPEAPFDPDLHTTLDPHSDTNTADGSESDKIKPAGP